MRVHHHVKFLLAAAAIAHATKAKTTTSVAVSTTNSTTELGSTAGRDKGDGMMNVLVQEVHAEAKTTTFAAGSLTQPSEESTYTVGRDDGERMMEPVEGLAEKLPNVLGEKLDNDIAEASSSQPFKMYEHYLQLVAKHRNGPAVAAAEFNPNLPPQFIAEMIVYAKTHGTHRDVALKLEKQQVKKWLEDVTSAHEVARLLGLIEAKDDLLAHPLFHYWSTYVKKFNKEYPDKKMSIIDVLTPYFYDDAALARLIVGAKKDPISEMNVAILREEQLNHWLNEGLSADDVFELLGLDKVENGLLTHPLFGYWCTYFVRVNVANDKDVTIVRFLVHKTLKQGISFDNFLKIELEKANFETIDKVNDLFMELKLDRVEDGLFTHPLFLFWRDCLKKFNAAQPRENPRTSVLQSLRKLYGDKGLIDLIQLQSKGTKSGKYALQVENELCMAWVTEKYSSHNIFEFLKLDRAGYMVLEDPLMTTFVKFTRAVNLNREGQIETKETISKTKEALFDENEIDRGLIIASEIGEPPTESEKALIRLWLDPEYHPGDVMKRFIGDDNMANIMEDGNLFENRLFITFMKYVEGYTNTGSRIPDSAKRRKHAIDVITSVAYVERKVDVGNRMNNQFEEKMDKLAEMIVSAKKSSSKSTLYTAERVERYMFEYWVEESMWLDTIFTMLKLNADMTTEKLLISPAFRWWLDYSDFLYTKTKPLKLDMPRKTLMNVFKDNNLQKLQEARMNEETDLVAEKAWKELLNEYAFAKIKPKQFPYLLTSYKKQAMNVMLFKPRFDVTEADVAQYTKVYNKYAVYAKKKEEIEAKTEPHFRRREEEDIRREEEEFQKRQAALQRAEEEGWHDDEAGEDVRHDDEAEKEVRHDDKAEEEVRHDDKAEEKVRHDTKAEREVRHDDAAEKEVRHDDKAEEKVRHDDKAEEEVRHDD